VECRFLRPDDQPRRRSFKDALDVLRDDTWFDDADLAKVEICHLPIAPEVASVGLSFDLAGVRSFVLLPAAKEFRGSREDDGRSVTSSIKDLQGAIVDGDNRTILASGTVLRRVESIPLDLGIQLTSWDNFVIDLVLAVLKVERGQVYRTIRDGLPDELRDTVPDRKALDFAKLSRVNVPPFKEFCFRLKKSRVPCPFSRQHYEEIMKRAGMWRG
jgi:hypothetical protein